MYKQHAYMTCNTYKCHVPLTTHGLMSHSLFSASCPTHYSRPHVPLTILGLMSHSLLSSSCPTHYSRPRVPLTIFGFMSHSLFSTSCPTYYSRPHVPLTTLGLMSHSLSSNWPPNIRARYVTKSKSICRLWLECYMSYRFLRRTLNLIVLKTYRIYFCFDASDINVFKMVSQRAFNQWSGKYVSN